MSRIVVAGSDLAGRRAARQSYERPWVKSQTLSPCIRNRPALQSHDRPRVQSQTLSSCIRNRPALQTSTLHPVQSVQARGPPAKPAPVKKPIEANATKLQPSSSKSLQLPPAAARKSLIPVRLAPTSKASAIAPKTGPPTPVVVLADGSQLKSALHKAGTAPKRVSWGGDFEVATYTKGMKTKFFDRGLIAAPEEIN